mgnify:CR=1 FL=1
MKYFRKLIGTKVYLSPLSADDAPLICGWFNDLAITKNLSIASSMVTVPSEQNWLSNACEGKDKSEIVHAIVDIATDTMIGTAGLHRIDLVHGLADFGILIGDNNYHDKGYGTEATKLTLDFAFNILNLRNVRLSVFEFNKRGQRAYEKAGFKLIGRRRKAWPIGGTVYDVIIMDAIAEEFESPFVRKAVSGTMTRE